MIRKLYDWVIGLARHAQALWALAIAAFIESSVFPIPPYMLVLVPGDATCAPLAPLDLVRGARCAREL